MLEAVNISVSIGSKKILNAVSMRAKPGELLVIAGPNGAGKSTLLRVLSEKTKLDTGFVSINGEDMYTQDAKQLAKIRAVLAQSYVTGLPFQVEEIVMMGRYPYFKEHPNPEDTHIVQEVLEVLDIAHLSNRVYATLSGGEQQRVQLARVLAQIWINEKDKTEEVNYLFLDEPVSSLDLYHQQVVLQTAKRMAAKGFCVIAVLHDLNLISQYADNVLLLSKGYVEAYGTPEFVFTKERIKYVYGLDVHLIRDPVSEQLLIIPDSTSFKINPTNNTKYYDNNNSINADRALESI
ncbi:heme ABC transporter ATP-binding protein [Cytophaga aurantiaca]|uniref:heme ABC transporter ATP-binding protein n=1 Tax=Cytophaga aurantiaca TaxID=29530 RepID=UPI00037C2D15|nr:heme ABC transporter ATP-binding protein [Cytophaga aurantiaca]